MTSIPSLIKNIIKQPEHDPDGFITMMLSIFFIVIMLVVFAYIRVAHARQ